MLQHSFNGHTVLQAEETEEVKGVVIPVGYVDVSNICKAKNKKVLNYTRTKTTQDFFDAVSENTGILVKDLIINIEEKFNPSQTWMQKEVAIDFCCSIDAELKFWAMRTLNLVIDGRVGVLDSSDTEAANILNEFIEKRRLIKEVNNSHRIIEDMDYSIRELKHDLYEERQSSIDEMRKMKAKNRDLNQENRSLKKRIEKYIKCNKSLEKLTEIMDEYERAIEGAKLAITMGYCNSFRYGSCTYDDSIIRYGQYFFKELTEPTEEQKEAFVDDYEHSVTKLMELEEKVRHQKDLIKDYKRLTKRYLDLLKTVMNTIIKLEGYMSEASRWDIRIDYKKATTPIREEFEDLTERWEQWLDGSHLIRPDWLIEKDKALFLEEEGEDTYEINDIYFPLEERFNFDDLNDKVARSLTEKGKEVFKVGAFDELQQRIAEAEARGEKVNQYIPKWRPPTKKKDNVSDWQPKWNSLPKPEETKSTES